MPRDRYDAVCLKEERAVDTNLADVGDARRLPDETVVRSAVALSVVIPCFNEEERIINTISLLGNYLEKQGQSFEVIVSDDGSHDGGPGLVERRFSGCREVRLIRERNNCGKGAAVRRGVLASSGEIVVFTDADLSYPVESIGACIEALRDHDVVVGSRNLSGSEIAVTPALSRRLTGLAFKWLVRSIVLSGFSDTQCGFKGFRGEAARRIFTSCQSNGFAFDVEVLALATLMGYSVTELPVRLQVDSSDSTINLTSDPVKMVAELMEIKARMRRLEKSLSD